MSHVENLDTPLLRLSSHDSFTLRDACNGVHVFGGIGSGKTSGSGKALAGAYLRAGMGGIVCCAKPDEVDRWQAYAKAHGRENSVIVFDETQGFNFITYELYRQGLSGIGSVTECIMQVLDSSNRAGQASGGSQREPFFEDAMRQLLNYTIPVLCLARGQVGIADIVAFVSTCTPPGMQKDLAAWKAASFAHQMIAAAQAAPRMRIDHGHWEAVLRYWRTEFPSIPERTRGNMTISLSTKLDRFKHGRLQRAFCGATTLVPELTFHGAVILLAMPALTWNEDGIIGQRLFKHMWQRAVDSRNAMDARHRSRPVFMWADEAQYFVGDDDARFISTCRESRACPVFLTQNLPTYYAALGRGDTHAADALIGKFNTQIFHQNACPRTNEFASDLIGRSLQERGTRSSTVGTSVNMGMNTSRNTSFGTTSSSGSSNGNTSSGSGSTSSSGDSYGDNRGRGHSSSTTEGYSHVMDRRIEPSFFSSELKSGGPANGGLISAVWYKAGANYRDSGANYLIPEFRQ